MDDWNYHRAVDQEHMTKKYLLDQSYALTGNMDIDYYILRRKKVNTMIDYVGVLLNTDLHNRRRKMNILLYNWWVSIDWLLWKEEFGYSWVSEVETKSPNSEM